MRHNPNYMGKGEAVQCATIHSTQQKRGCQRCYNTKYTVKGEVVKCDETQIMQESSLSSAQ